MHPEAERWGLLWAHVALRSDWLGLLMWPEALPGVRRLILTEVLLAAVAHVSPSRLAHLFLAEVRQSPQRYIEHRRLVVAAQFLELPDSSVGSVARAVGFNDPLYFSTRFQAADRSKPLRLPSGAVGTKGMTQRNETRRTRSVRRVPLSVRQFSCLTVHVLCLSW